MLYLASIFAPLFANNPNPVYPLVSANFVPVTSILDVFGSSVLDIVTTVFASCANTIPVFFLFTVEASSDTVTFFAVTPSVTFTLAPLEAYIPNESFVSFISKSLTTTSSVAPVGNAAFPLATIPLFATPPFIINDPVDFIAPFLSVNNPILLVPVSPAKISTLPPPKLSNLFCNGCTPTFPLVLSNILILCELKFIAAFDKIPNDPSIFSSGLLGLIS